MLVDDINRWAKLLMKTATHVSSLTRSLFADKTKFFLGAEIWNDLVFLPAEHLPWCFCMANLHVMNEEYYTRQ